MRAVLRELRRRHVFRVTAAYVIVSWVLVQVAGALESALHMPDWFDTVITSLLLLGFPVAILLTWAFELTPAGVKRTAPARENEAITPVQATDYILIGLLTLVVIFAGISAVRGPHVSVPQTEAESSSTTQFQQFPEKSIAVLAFADMSPEGDQEWFTDGLTEEILNSLARLPELKVTGRTSAFHFKGQHVSVQEIAMTLGVKYVVEGSVRRADDVLRVTYQVIRAADGFNVYSDSIDSELQSVLDVQRKIAERIAEALNIAVDDGKREAMFALGTRDVEAYEYFLHGRQLLNEWLNDGQNEKIWQSKVWFDRAIDADPRFAAAYALRQHSYIQYLDGNTTTPLHPSATNESITFEWAQRQLISDIDNTIKYALDDGLRLVAEFNRALYSDNFNSLPNLANQIDPSLLAATGDVSTLARITAVLTLVGHEDKALSLAKSRIERNPLDALAYNLAWRASHVAGDSSQAIEYLRIGLEKAGDSQFLEMNYVMTNLAIGNHAEAIRLAEDPDWGAPAVRQAILAIAYAAGGRDLESRRILDDFTNKGNNDVLVATAFDLLGERDRARQMFAALDSRPGYNATILFVLTEFGGRVPYDLAVTPNFAARLSEAGIEVERHEFRRAMRNGDPGSID